MSVKLSFLEFFAGGGMARIGLGDSWRCLFANDIDPQKCAAYRENFGGGELVEGDISTLDHALLPQTAADLMWGSFPCQDLSLAGARGGIKAERSGHFFSFWRHAEHLIAKGRAPRIIAVENVVGLLTSNGGRDFAAIADLMTQAGYAVTAAVLDAKVFVPQSRPRLFMIAFGKDCVPPVGKDAPGDVLAPAALHAALDRLPPTARKRWFWLDAAPTLNRNTRLSDIIEWDAKEWNDPAYTKQLLAMMSNAQRRRLDALLKNRARRAGAAFRRTRIENGITVQRLEARFDGLAGCLRTPAGGSSRQIILAIDKGKVKSRLMTPREAARLMGLPEDYGLPESTTAALKLCGDGVCVPAVGWLSENVLEPALRRRVRKAA